MIQVPRPRMIRPEVELTPSEIHHAALIGIRRRLNSRAKGLTDRWGEAHAWDFNGDIVGACGETAFCKALGLYLAPKSETFQEPDHFGIEIKTSSLPEIGISIHYPDERIFALVLGSIPKFRLAGWIQKGDAARRFKTYAKKPEWDKRIWVPARALNAIETIFHVLDDASGVL